MATSSSQPKLSHDWWGKNKPKALKDGGFGDLLKEYEKAKLSAHKLGTVEHWVEAAKALQAIEKKLPDLVRASQKVDEEFASITEHYPAVIARERQELKPHIEEAKKRRMATDAADLTKKVAAAILDEMRMAADEVRVSIRGCAEADEAARKYVATASQAASAKEMADALKKVIGRHEAVVLTLKRHTQKVVKWRDELKGGVESMGAADRKKAEGRLAEMLGYLAEMEKHRRAIESQQQALAELVKAAARQ